MAFDIEAKIRQLQSQLEKKTNELQSFNSANYFGHEAKEVRRLNREIAVLKEELNKWETTKKMNKNLKDSLKQAERELQKAEADRNKHRGERYWEENYIAAKKDVERARENLARAERNHSRSNRDDCGEKIFTKGKENEMAKDDDATKGGAIKEYGDKNSETMEDACSTKDSYVTWVKPSGVEYKIGDVIQFKGKEVKITKITGNVVEATVLGEAKDGCSSKDADPRVADAEAMIKLCGGVM